MRQADKGGPRSREQCSPSGLAFSSARNLLASAAPPNLPISGAWGGQGMGLVAPVPSCAPPSPTLTCSGRRGQEGKGSAWLLLAEELEPDRGSGTGAQRRGRRRPSPRCLQSATLCYQKALVVHML